MTGDWGLHQLFEDLTVFLRYAWHVDDRHRDQLHSEHTPKVSQETPMGPSNITSTG